MSADPTTHRTASVRPAGAPGWSGTALDASAVRRWTSAAAASLARRQSELDALNVFPVADSDTGTNLCLTLADASAAVQRVPLGAPVRVVAAAFARAAVVGARGNSGVIVAQYLVAMLQGLPTDGAPLSPQRLAAALRSAADAAREAVADPAEGTVLTVARCVADHAGDAALGSDVVGTLEVALEAGYRALERTAAQLPALRAAGVVDAGAWGLLLVIDALAATWGSVPAGQRASPIPAVLRRPPYLVAAGAPAPAGAGSEEPWPAGHGSLEVMYRVEGPPGPGGSRLGADLRAALEEVGGSVAVVGHEGLRHVHVHTDDPVAALRAGAVVGGVPLGARIGRVAGGPAHPSGLGLVAVTASPGLTGDLARSGAVVVLADDGPLAPELLRAAADSGEGTVLVLASVPVADGAAGGAVVLDRLGEVGVVVGAATLAALDPAVGVAEALAEVRRAVGRCRTSHGSVHNLQARATRLLDGGGTLLTVVTSAGTPSEAVDALARGLAARRPPVEVVVLHGGAAGSDVALGAE